MLYNIGASKVARRCSRTKTFQFVTSAVGGENLDQFEMAQRERRATDVLDEAGGEKNENIFLGYRKLAIPFAHNMGFVLNMTLSAIDNGDSFQLVFKCTTIRTEYM